MSDTFAAENAGPPQESTRPGSDRSERDAALADQAQRWRAGTPALVEEYLKGCPGLRDDRDAILDLIYNEVLLRTQRGEAPRLEQFAARFPELADALGPIFEIHQAIESGSELSPSLANDRTLGSSLPACPAGVAAPATEVPGYEILERLGHGGMGVVYKARQKSLGRTVALKMILAGSHARAEELMRFRREAETVARLAHPNIVQIHEVGEHDGRPYFSLEYVAGGSLDKKLAGAPQPAHEAAQLVETLARVVHYAHGQGIIHRDLKPANILLAPNPRSESRHSPQIATARTEKLHPGSNAAFEHSNLEFVSDFEFRISDFEPKITDFGLARLGGAAGQTQSGDVLGTPSYMAPEQAAGHGSAIGPATDVYALGAILYELLTGRPPFRSASALETLQQVIGQEPVSVRRLQPKVPHDLETVCLKCLQKDPKRRYASAEALADDLRRFQEGRPILARPVPAWERALKWAKRRPALACLFAVSIAAVGAIIVYSVRLQTALMDANEQRRIAQAINDFLLNDLLRQADARAQANRNFTAEPDLRVRDLLDRAAAAIDSRFGDQPLVEAGVRLSIGDAYRGIGDVAKAIAQLERAVALYRQHRGPDHAETLIAANNLASAYARAGKDAEALRLLEETVEKLAATLGPDDDRTLIGMSNLATALQSVGKFERAVALQEEILKKRQTRLGVDHPDTLTTMNNLAHAYVRAGHVDRGIPMYEETVERRTAKLGPKHPDTLTTMNNLAFAYNEVGRLDEAIALYKDTFEKRKATFGPDHPDTLGVMNNLASAYQNAEKLDEAIPLFEDALKKLQTRLGVEHPQPLMAAANLASALHQSAKGDRTKIERVVAMYEDTLEKQRKVSADPAEALTTMNNLAKAYRDLGKLDKAIPLLQEAWEKFKASSGPNHPATVKCLNNLAVATWNNRDFARAVPLLREALEKLEARYGPEHADTLLCLMNLSQAYFQSQRPAEAETLLAKYIDRRRPKLPPDSLALAYALNLLGDCRVQLARHADALAPLRESLALYEKHAPKDVLRYDTQSLLGAALAGLKHFTEAEPHLLDSYKALAAMEPELPARRRELVTDALERIVQFYEAWGQPENAAAWRKKLMERKQRLKNGK